MTTQSTQESTESTEPGEPWRDPARPVAERVEDLLSRMSTREKIAQLYGVWVGLDAAGEVAPHQHDFAAPPDWQSLLQHGIGQLTRVFGTAPVDPLMGAQALARSQRQIMNASRFGIPAMAHEECLTGLAAWRAPIYPSPLCWGASFDPGLVEAMGAQIGGLMRRLGVHQGLAPVLDVTRDLRWGRVEETIGEDPHLVGAIGSAYVRGLEQAGVVATLKHFVGYSASRAGRNLAPVSIGPREIADVLLPPFEQALRAGARSVMNAYVDLDGLPAAASAELLTETLREKYGFTGTVVADYFSIAFLHRLHQVAADPADAAAQALRAGLDVELPTVDCYGEPLHEAVRSGAVEEELVDRAARRVLRQKCELGLLDAGWTPEAPILRERDPHLDDAPSRALAEELARRSIVLLSNDGTLPLRDHPRLAVVGPRAAEPGAMLGCYSFPNHVGVRHPEVPLGVDVPTLLDALRADHQVDYALGCPVLGGSDEEIAEAVRVAREAEVCVAVLGDQSGLFGRGTSGEGCDAADLRLPGRQEELLEALLGTGTPVVLVLLVGRPYDLSGQAERLAGIVCGFFPGEAGGTALADVLCGRTNPSGRLPVSFPAGPGGQPATYLAAPLAGRSEVSNIDPTALFPFGHGRSYAPANWLAVDNLTGPDWPTDGPCRIAVTLANDAEIATTEVVQVYLHRPVADVVLPVRRLIAFARVDLEPGTTTTVQLDLPAELTAYTGRDGTKHVRPGPVELHVGASSVDIRGVLGCRVTASD